MRIDATLRDYATDLFDPGAVTHPTGHLVPLTSLMTDSVQVASIGYMTLDAMIRTIDDHEQRYVDHPTKWEHALKK